VAASRWPCLDKRKGGRQWRAARGPVGGEKGACDPATFTPFKWCGSVRWRDGGVIMVCQVEEEGGGGPWPATVGGGLAPAREHRARAVRAVGWHGRLMPFKTREGEPLTGGATRHSASQWVKPKFESIQTSLNDFKPYQINSNFFLSKQDLPEL
jgi:hypothetical protein